MARPLNEEKRNALFAGNRYLYGNAGDAKEGVRGAADKVKEAAKWIVSCI
jgi:hypothetical protein